MAETIPPPKPGYGVVVVEGFEIAIAPITQAEERSLNRQLEAAALKQIKDPYTNAAATLAAAKKHDREAWLELLERIALIASKPPRLSQGEFLEYLAGPDGVARDLFSRGKKATPKLDLEHLRTIITAANVDDIATQLADVLQGKAPGATEAPTLLTSQGPSMGGESSS